MTISPKPTFQLAVRVSAEESCERTGGMPKTKADSMCLEEWRCALAFEGEPVSRDPDSEAGRGRLGLAY
jgi:hypothetical protein